MFVLAFLLACTVEQPHVAQGDVSLCLNLEDPHQCYDLLDRLDASDERSLAFGIACKANFRDACERSLAELTDRTPIERTVMVLGACRTNRDPKICQLAIDFAKQQGSPRYDQVIKNGEILLNEVQAESSGSE